MTDEGKITMNEFKVVVERFEDNQKKFLEVMNYRFDKVEQDVGILKQDVGILKQDSATLKHEVALLHEGQTAIRADLRRKVSYDDFEMLEKRVARLESKTA